MDKNYRELIEKIASGEISTRDELDLAKRGLCEKLGLDRFPRNSDILMHARGGEKQKVLALLQKKPTRTLSGVAVVAAMTKPSRCPHGQCRYCPGGPAINVPQSYTGEEPATRRAIQYGYDPFLQTTFRLYQLKRIGHPVDKVDLIVMGGTLTAQSLDYQEWFVKRCLQAMNEFEDSFASIDDAGEEAFTQAYCGSQRSFQYLEDVQEANESAAVRCVGLTFEPRPDWARRVHIDYMLGFGVTRVEIGVQNPDDEVYEKVERGHSVEDVVAATRELKDSGLKVGYHLMPGIVGFDSELEGKSFSKVFFDDRFKPDMVKIYPCIVLKNTKYHEAWMKGEFTPMSTEEAVEIIVAAKQMMPAWMRTMRIMRDIPSTLVEAGIKNSNLGQLVYERMEELGVRCRCIRCREVGRFVEEGVEPDPEKIELVSRTYKASGGTEKFLSFEDSERDILVGFLRLRKPGAPFRPEIDEETALVRELHVYGPMVEIGEKPVCRWQHRGYGKELLEEAERVAAQEFDAEKILVTSGVGARGYYRRFGYEKTGPYMGKKI